MEIAKIIYKYNKVRDYKRQHRDRLQLPAPEAAHLCPLHARLAEGWHRGRHRLVCRWHESRTVHDHLWRQAWQPLSLPTTSSAIYVNAGRATILSPRWTRMPTLIHRASASHSRITLTPLEASTKVLVQVTKKRTDYRSLLSWWAVAGSSPSSWSALKRVL